MQCTVRLSRCTRLLHLQDHSKQYIRSLIHRNSHATNFDKLFAEREFQSRHIGPRDHEQLEMLKTIGFTVSR